MAEPSKDALGDNSGLKGTEYHLLYALWLLLRDGADRVSFYQGNDLLANPIAPPKTDDADTAPPIPIHASESNEDVWIQLKSTESPWSPSGFIPANTKDDNLLKNFLCNAVRSESEGKSWRVELGTQGYVKKQELEAFISRPDGFSDLNKHLHEIIDKAQRHLKKEGFLPNQYAENNLLKISTSILSQLARAKPISRERLLAEIELELAYACYDQDLAAQVLRALLGALLSDVSPLPVAGHPYDLNWINEVAGFAVKTRALFDTDPVRSCTRANTQREPRDWNSNYFASRARLEKALDQFLVATQTLFVLVGRSGSGKSWSATDWAARVLHERMRLFLPATALDHTRELSALVAEALRSQTGTEIGNEKLLRRFQGASRVDGRGPGVIIVDDLQVRSTDFTLTSDLASLAKQCREYDIKLVLTCQEQIWKRHRLWKEIAAADLYVADIDAEPSQDSIPLEIGKNENISSENSLQPKVTYSFHLGDFTPDEMIASLRCRLPRERAERAGLFLAAPSFAPLRNPYLLTRYVEIHGTDLGSGAPPPTVSIDDLLDTRITQVLESAAQSLSLNITDVEPAFEILVESLWNSRVDGLPYSQSVNSISPLLMQKAADLISELREKGFLTWESPLRIVEQPIAERLFAKRLATHNAEVRDISIELEPHEDIGVAAALMRESNFDPIALAEALIAQDLRWIKGVSEGLAQCDPRDYRILGFLAALMRSDPQKVFIIEAANALGQLAARDKRAFKFVAAMYFSTTSSDRYGGEYALGSAMEFNPHSVAAAIRLKLSRAAGAKGVFLSEIKKKRDHRLMGALEPLSLIRNTKAAEAGSQILRRYEYLGGKNEHDLNYKFLEDIDSVRGRIALYDSQVLDQLLSELKSEDRLIRYRAACALRGPVIEQPLRLQQELYAAMLREPEYVQTINRVLLAAYPLVNADPRSLLKALVESPLTKWDRALSTGQVLGHLGDLAWKFPNEVSNLLPKRLDAFSPDDRALVSEMLSYAWWRCAEHVSDAKQTLSDLTAPDLMDVSSELVPFAIRGAAIAQLGLICLDQGGADELAGEQYFYPFGDLIYTYLNTRQFMRRRARTILSHPGYERLRDLLIKAVTEGEPVNINPLNQPLVQSVFRSVVVSLEMLTTLANAMSDPMPLLNAVPRDWRALHMASELIENGKREQSLIEFTEIVCEEVRHGWTTMQASAEREKCLAQLAALKSDHQRALEEHRAIIDDHFFQVTGKMRGLALLIDAHPEDTLALLDKGIRDSNDQASLFFLEDETRYWAALLLGRLYARMFDSRVIRPKDAAEWCEQVLVALSGLPTSIYKDEYQNVYTCVQSWLKGATEPPKPLPHRDQSMLRDSHALAVSILTMGYEAISQGKSSISLDEVLSDRRGWIEGKFIFEDETISQSTSEYLNYVFPAVRLALIAVGDRFSLEDPASRLLVDRKMTKDLLSKHRYVFQQETNIQSDMEDRKELRRAVLDIQNQLQRTPRDETLWAWYGDALLRANRFDDAEAALNRCLSLPSCSSDTRASAFYDLACVKARLDLESECRQLLTESNSLRALDKQHTASDPDFESMRDIEWFKNLLS